MEGRISTIENQLRFAEIISDTDEDSDTVTLGRKITFRELPDGEEESYTIVGTAEADPLGFKISNSSPIAQAILGKRLGDTATIDSPGGSFDVKIIKIEKAD